MQGFNMGRYHPPDGTTLQRPRPPGVSATGIPTIRFEMPYPIWCTTCPKPTIIGQGVRFNAQKTRAGAYHSTPIWRFTFRHTACAGEIVMQTDPQHTAYVVISGGRKRDYGPDAEEGLVVDKEREILRNNAFASLEKTIADRQASVMANERIEGLLDDSEKYWADPYSQNQALRKTFRAGRKVREKEAVATEALKEKMGLGIELVPVHDDDARIAALIDFGVDEDEGVLSRPLFAGRGKGGGFVAEIIGNTRASLDPFLKGRGERGVGRLPGVKRKRLIKEEEEKEEEEEEEQYMAKRVVKKEEGEEAVDLRGIKTEKDEEVEVQARGGLVDYDSD